MSHDPGPVPDRWLKCPRKCVNLVGGKFFAFKTPLSERFDPQVQEGYRFPPSMVFQTIKLNKWKLGFWIDLTNTNRFYDESKVQSGYNFSDPVKYMKVPCRGHGETPSLEQTKTFIDVCKMFIRTHPLEIIGVHCTHGFNRTGFMIVSYLVEVEDMSVGAALREFASCRPPGIYKGDYIKELFRRYDDVDYAPDPPLRPDWCLEYDDRRSDDEAAEDDEDHGESRKRGNKSGGSRPKRRKMGKSKFMEGVPGVTLVSNESKASKLLQIAQKMCGLSGDGKKFPGCQPVSMDQNNISKLKEKPYTVSWKADGTRYMMLILGENEVYFLDRDSSLFEVAGLRFVHRKNTGQHLTSTLVDGEMVIDDDNGKRIPRYLIYDIVQVSGVNVMNYNFYPERLLTIETDVIKPRRTAIAEGRINRFTEPFSVRAKSFFPAEKAKSYLSEKFIRQLSHEPDGLIFQPTIDPYVPEQCPEVLKWKPPSLNSIDFRMKITEEKGLGLVTRKICGLYVGGLSETFGVMKFKSSLKQYDNKIIECKYENNNWVFMRERTDKSFPNSWETANAVFESIKRPVTKEYLLEFIDKYRYKADNERMPPPGPGIRPLR